ncbi:uncharacterized protein At4g14100 [Elaeis guineensis]|uniref:Uncharacterized protein At4g14100 n=1 Tax=Elaeis guineensis var. tenera TaxID=51953 RepID=A0A6I9QJK1_ELAGV|nr:uncharacterized protein At4g14100 [Elaeis guineensis]
MERLSLYSVFPLLTLLLPSAMIGLHCSDPAPMPWPERFHALLYMNLTATGELMVTDIWYDLPRGRNVHLMQRQLDDLLYNVEWENGTSFYYTLGSTRYCHPKQWGIGLPRPDWLADSTYLGRRYTDGFLCHVWTKLDFVWYYEDVDTRRPVRWDFFDGVTNYVMTFEPGASLNDSQLWQAPSHCFSSGEDDGNDHGNKHDVQGAHESNPKGLDMKAIFDLNFRRLI